MRTNSLKAYLQNKKIVILGAAKTGKTTLSDTITDRPVIHTDQFLKYKFEEVPYKIIESVKGLDSYCVEGIQAARAIRKGLPVDVAIILKQAMGPQTDKHLSQWKGVETILAQCPGLKIVYLE